MPAVELKYIRFCYKNTTTTPCFALLLRQNNLDEVDFDLDWTGPGRSPEWTFRSGNENNALESPVAYPLADIEGAPVSVFVSVKVDWQAVGGSSGGPKAIQLKARAAAGTVDRLGDIGPVTITEGAMAGPDLAPDPDFPSALLVRMTMNPGVSEVGVDNARWTWTFRSVASSSGAWTDLETTNHRVFVTLDRSGPPWNHTAGDPHNPWVPMLEWVCDRAKGCRSDASALRRLTKIIHRDMQWSYDPAENYDGESQYASLNMVNGLCEFLLETWVGAEALLAIPSLADAGFDQVNCYDLAGGLLCMGALLGVDIDGVHHTPFGFIHKVSLPNIPQCNNPMFGKGFPYSSDEVVPTDQIFGRGDFEWHAWTALAGKVYDPTVKVIHDPAKADEARVAALLVWLILTLLGGGSRADQWFLNTMDVIDGWQLGVVPDVFLARVRDITSETGDTNEISDKVLKNNGTDYPWTVDKLF